MKQLFRKHNVAAADALLKQYALNAKSVTAEDLEKLPSTVCAAIINLLPEGWVTAGNTQPEVSDVKYLSVAAAEKYASISRWTIGRAAARNELQLIKLGASKSSKVLVDRAEIDRWLKSRRCR